MKCLDLDRSCKCFQLELTDLCTVKTQENYGKKKNVSQSAEGSPKLRALPSLHLRRARATSRARHSLQRVCSGDEHQGKPRNVSPQL